ncbi:MAG: NAD(P)/FAD-dependent oxidoreductase [Bacteriovorax sp.]|nr:NAD(P)/FAD-dependent oxidoreductase [Bacteriovorax sp.]
MGNSRREFLVKAFLGTAGLVAKKSFANNDLPKPKIEKCDCIVIGAGMSGLIAARDLTFPEYSKNGFKTILLEASSRIGGRILTMEDSRLNGPIEMGAEYLHRKPGSVALWKEIELYRPEMEKVRRMIKGYMYYDGWENNLRRHIMIAKEWKLSDILTFAKKIDAYSGPNISAKEWIDQQNYTNLGRNLVDLYFTGHIPGHLDEISVKGFSSDRISEQEMEWNEYGYVNGYSNFLDQIVQGVNQHKGREIDIRYGAFVKYIKYNMDGVEVSTADGKIYQAGAVILTASVGMLKSGEITFDPPLPSFKLDALHCMGMGDEAKVALKFKKRFWPDNAVILNRIDNHREMARTYFIPFASDEKKNNVLTVLFAGAEADKIKEMSDLEVIKALCRDFDKMFPKEAQEAGGSTYNLLETTGTDEHVYLRWQWSNDPFSKGSDSFLKAGMEKSVKVTQARHELASPLMTPGLFWAGEATAVGTYTQPCSTHGAHFSGSRAAIEVTQFLNNKKRTRF